jgi:nucleoside-diphosphate-sugar epimerase
MKVIVTGATGFIGRHVVASLCDRHHQVVATGRDREKARRLSWFDQVEFIAFDLSSDPARLSQQHADADVLIHLAWGGLPSYKELVHLEANLPQSYHLVKSAVAAGIPQVLVVGTCFEYGQLQGCLNEDTPTNPCTAYGIAKDSLRRSLEMLRNQQPFVLQWARIFYLYGDGQNPKSLLAQLDAALDRGDSRFPMSGGEQLRDYLPVEEVARRLVVLAEHRQSGGIYNICRGQPISVRQLVEDHCVQRGKTIPLQRGVYPYPDYEPFAFWGDPRKFLSLEASPS